MGRSIQILIDLHRREVCEEETDLSVFLACPEADRRKLSHIQAPFCGLLGDALGSNPDSQQTKITQVLFSDTLAALNQVTQTDHERRDLRRAGAAQQICPGVSTDLCHEGAFCRVLSCAVCDNERIVVVEILSRFARRGGPFCRPGHWKLGGLFLAFIRGV